MSEINYEANGRKYLIVQVPKDVVDIQVIAMQGLDYDVVDKTESGYKYICTLPDRNYGQYFLAEMATGDEAHKIVEGSIHSEVCYKNYEFKPLHYAKNTDSLMSLILSKFSSHKNYKHLIIEVKKN